MVKVCLTTCSVVYLGECPVWNALRMSGSSWFIVLVRFPSPLGNRSLGCVSCWLASKGSSKGQRPFWPEGSLGLHAPNGVLMKRPLGLQLARWQDRAPSSSSSWGLPIRFTLLSSQLPEESMPWLLLGQGAFIVVSLSRTSGSSWSWMERLFSPALGCPSPGGPLLSPSTPRCSALLPSFLPSFLLPSLPSLFLLPLFLVSK